MLARIYYRLFSKTDGSRDHILFITQEKNQHGTFSLKHLGKSIYILRQLQNAQGVPNTLLLEQHLF